MERKLIKRARHYVVGIFCGMVLMEGLNLLIGYEPMTIPTVILGYLNALLLILIANDDLFRKGSLE